jgi:nitrite reductase/ring-hydroxylating ferredoxin subunit
MAEKFIGKLSEFQDGDRRIVYLGDHEIGVFRHEGAFYAYSNFCLHQGGPACEGLTIAKVEERTSSAPGTAWSTTSRPASASPTAR